ncbi:MAG: hypothetical protein Q9183_003259 [Haloplaca sp. 2 TL-2023]
MSRPGAAGSESSYGGLLSPEIEKAPFGPRELDLIVMFRLVPEKPLLFTLISYFLNGLCDKKWTGLQVFKVFVEARETWNNQSHEDTYGCFNRWENEYNDKAKNSELKAYYKGAVETFKSDYEDWYRNEEEVEIDSNLEAQICKSIPSLMFTPWPFLLQCMGPKTAADKHMDEAIDTKYGSKPSILMHYNVRLTANERIQLAFEQLMKSRTEKARFFAKLKAERRTTVGQPEVPVWFTDLSSRHLS